MARNNALALSMAHHEGGAVLAALGPLLVGGVTLFCLDGGNVFNPRPLAAWLRTERADVQVVLAQRVFLSRSFTCYQLAEATEKLLPPLLARESAAVLVLGIEAMFLDEDIRLVERNYLFGKILQQLQALRQRGLPILVTCGPGGVMRGSHDANPNPNPWVSRVMQTMQPVAGVGRALPTFRSSIYGTHDTDL